MSTSPESRRCDGCESQTSSIFCEGCNAFYCRSCDETAHAIKNTKGHIRVSANMQINQPNRFCSSHPEKRGELFCKDCSELICTLCKDFGGHKHHDVDLAISAATELRAKLVEKLEAIEKVASSAKGTLEKVDAALSDLGHGTEHGTCADAKKHIREHFSRLLDTLSGRHDELLRHVDEVSSQKEKQLTEQSEKLVKSIANAEIAIRDAITVCQLDDVSVCNLFMETINNLSDQQKSWPKDTIPVEEDTIPVAFDARSLDTIKSHGLVGGPLCVRFRSVKSGLYIIEWDEPLRSENRCWTSYSVKGRILSSTVAVVGNGWTKVGTFMEKDLGTLSTPSRELTVVLSEHPSATMEFLVMATDKDGVSTAWSVSPQKLRLPDRFDLCVFEIPNRPFSASGLFYFLGSDGGKREYCNPHISGDVIVSWSSIGGGSVEQFVDEVPSGDFSYTLDEQLSWMAVDIGTQRLFRPTAYALRHDTQGPRGVLRNWLLQGRRSEDDDWSTLSVHIEDTSLSCLPGSVALFPINMELSETYRFFRIIQNGRNSSDKNRLLCSGFELYGTMYM